VVRHTYYSRDAGFTWRELRKGRWAYEIANHGALLAGISRDSPVNSMIYTISEGNVSYVVVLLPLFVSFVVH